ncbi:hypothetical protein [Actinomyces dentalis]|jgi:hypothetical protein|uniref:hypothetical protein n=1 Tax=Actinomyces dentalis TaxID=272548 RepID=UPI002355C142|nr:hypothetical protein [Actinomyces dentalis]
MEAHMPLECPLCASRRPFLRVERFKNSDGRIGVRAYQDTGGIAAWRANGFESIPSDAGAQVVEAYTVCRNGHVALDDPGVGAAHKVCTLGSVGSGKSQLLHRLLQLDPPIWDQAPQNDREPVGVFISHKPLPYGASPIDNPDEVVATAAANSEPLRTALLNLFRMELRLREVRRRNPLTGDRETVLVGTLVDEILLRYFESEYADDLEYAQELADDWGTNLRAPYLYPITLTTGGTSLTKHLAIVDLPGEATREWTTPTNNPYVNSDDDLSQLEDSATILAIVDPVLADWCFNRLDDSTRSLALRPISDETTTTRETMRAESSAITRKLLQDISHEVQDADNASLTVIAISKCDAIRYALEHASKDAPRGQYDIGRWNDLIPKEQVGPFVRSAKNALSRMSGRVEASQPMASAQVREFFDKFRMAPGMQIHATASLLADLSDPWKFWNLVMTGEEFNLAVNMFTLPGGAVTHTVSLNDPSNLKPHSFAVESAASSWNRGVSGERIQMQDVAACALASALLATIISENTVAQLNASARPTYALTAARYRIAEDGGEHTSDGAQAGCFQALRHIISPALGV